MPDKNYQNPSSVRKLAAIMFTDIVGFTALMGKDSGKAIKLVRNCREIQKPLVEKHNGQWLKDLGDGAMAKFNTALDAVNCAIEIQEYSRTKIDAKIRIGIHSGDIEIDDGEVYGNGVNIAARLESIADPGGVYISDSIEKAIKGQTNIQAKYLGEIHLKNVGYGVRTYALQGIGLPIPDLKKEKKLTGRLLAEIERRGVARAGLMYILISILVILVYPYIQSVINFSSVSIIILMIFLGIGFLIALYLAWNYEKGSDGFIKTSTHESWQNPLSVSKRKPFTGNVLFSGISVIILLLIIVQGNKSFFYEGDKPDVVFIKDKSIAVLPFADMSPDKDQEYFSDGMAEEIINTLAQIPDLKVAARTSAFQFRGEEKDIKAIGEALNVATVLEGSIRKSNNRVRVTAQLINVSDGFHLWSQTYERELNDIFAIQDELSKSIVSALQMQISEPSASLVKDQTTNVTAYNLYLQGRYYWNKRTVDDLNRSIELYEKAIQEDPDYALAYCGLSDVYNVLAWWFQAPSETFPKAKEAALKALEIDPSLGQAHTGLAYVQTFYEWDWEAAEKSFQLAHELNPNYATAHQWHAILYETIGNSEASRQESKKAIELDPLSLIIWMDISQYYLWDGDHENALEMANEILDMNPDYSQGHFALYNIYWYLGKEDLAFDHFVQWRAAYDEDSEILREGYGESGWKGAAERLIPILEARMKEEYVNPINIAIYYLHMEDFDKVLDYLELASEQRTPALSFVRLRPKWRPLHSEPRFQAIFKKMGLPPP
jgi:TolB-like protein